MPRPARNINPEYVPARDAGRLYGYTGDYVTRLARDGKIDAKRIGRQWIVDPRSVDAFAKTSDREKRMRRDALRIARKRERAGMYVAPMTSTSRREVPVPTTPVPVGVFQKDAVPSSARTFSHTVAVVGMGVLLALAVYTEPLAAINGTFARAQTVAGDNIFERIAYGVYTTTNGFVCDVAEHVWESACDAERADEPQTQAPHGDAERADDERTEVTQRDTPAWVSASVRVDDGSMSSGSTAALVGQSVSPQSELQYVVPDILATVQPLTMRDLAVGLLALRQLEGDREIETRTIIERSVGGTADNLVASIGEVSRNALGLAGGALTGVLTTSSSIGVGTTSPFADLSVSGDLALTGKLYDAHTSPGVSGYILQSTGSSTNWVATSTLGIGGGSSAFLDLADTQNAFGAHRLIFTNSGATALTDSSTFVFDGTNLGIGTGSPSGQLHISDTSTSTLIIEADSANGGLNENENATLALYQDGGAVRGFVGLNGLADVRYTDALANATYLEARIADGTADLQFVTGATSHTANDGTARMTITEDGRIGIGTSNPGAALTIDSKNESTYAWEVRKNGTLYAHQVISDSAKGVGFLNGTYLALQNVEGNQNPQLRLVNNVGSNTATLLAYDNTDAGVKHTLELRPSGELYLNPSNRDSIVVADTSIVPETDGAGYIGTTTKAFAAGYLDMLHLGYGASGGTASAGADELIIEGAGATGLSLLSPNTQTSHVAFGDPESNVAGLIEYGHVTDTVHFSTAASRRLTIDGDGDVGIGTVTPGSVLPSGAATGSRILEVSSASSTVDTVFSLNSNSSAVRADIWLDRSVGDVYFDNRFDVATGDIFFRTRTAGTPVNSLTLTGAGWAGVNVASPASALHIYQDDANTNSATGMTIEQDGAGDAQLQFLLTGAQRWVAGIDNSDSDKFKIGTGAGWVSDESLVLTTSGDVGVGTADPNATLHIYTSDQFTNDIGFNVQTDGNRNATFQLQNLGVEWQFSARTSSEDNRFQFSRRSGGSWSTPMVILTDGNVGIGTTSPASRLEVAAAESGNVGLRVVGNSADDANLQEWQDSSGSTLARVTRNGLLDLSNTAFPTTYTTVIQFNDWVTGTAEVAGGFGSGFIKWSGNNKMFANYISDLPTNSLFGGGVVNEDYRRFRIAGNGTFYIGSGSADQDTLIARDTGGGINISTTLTNASTFSVGLTALQTADAFQIRSSGSSSGDLFVVDADGNVGIGTTDPLATLDVRGAVALNSNALFVKEATDGNWKIGYNAGGFSKSLVTNSIDFVSANNADGVAFGKVGQTPSFEIQNTGTVYVHSNLGIGTTSPWKKLSVSGDLALTGALFDSAASAGTSGYVLQATGSGTNWVATSTLGISDGSSVWTESGSAAYFTSGNIGIGTTSPYATLSVVGETVAEYFTATSTTATSTFAGGLAVDTSGLVYDHQTGRVGVSTAQPEVSLTVSGGARFYPDGMGIGASFFDISTQGTSLELNAENNVGQARALIFSTGSTNRMHITTAGNVGIGDASPAAMLTVGNGDLFQVNSGGAIAAATGITSSGALTLTSSSNSYFAGTGNVGIGTTTPSYALSIHGATGDAVSPGIRISSDDSDFGNMYDGIMEVDSGGLNIYTQIDGGNDGGQLILDLMVPYVFVKGDFVALVDNTYSLGEAGVRFTEVHATNGTIQTSDERLKTNIEESAYGLDALMELRPVMYNWKENPSGERHVGLIAQEVMGVVPEVVHGDAGPGGMLGINYANLTPVMIRAIQEQQLTLDEIIAASSSVSTIEYKAGFWERLGELAGSFADGVLSIFQVNVERLCVGETCVTEAELKQLLEQQNVEPDSGGETGSEQNATSTPVNDLSDKTPTATGTPEAAEMASSTPDTATSTPEGGGNDDGEVASTTPELAAKEGERKPETVDEDNEISEELKEMETKAEKMQIEDKDTELADEEEEQEAPTEDELVEESTEAPTE